jgi:3D (Asp-Asp-Asp) domain-containing protein
VKSFKFLFILVFLFGLLGCAGDSSSGSKRTAAKPKKILNDSEKLKFITPTIYFVPDYSQSMDAQCAEKSELNVRVTKENIKKISVCKKVYKGCALQGSCYIMLDGAKKMINYHKKVSGQILFALRDLSICRHGVGDSSDSKASYKTMCLDPFYSLAADTSIYPLGTVIHIPAVAGTALPNGSVHDGFFIVRDTGGGIDGPGRFDFFTGDFSLNASNPFHNLGLGDSSNFEYFVVSGTEAQLIKDRHNFPYLKN